MPNIVGEMGTVPRFLNEVTYISLDPGVLKKSSTGITIWNQEGKPIHTNELDIDNLHYLLDKCESDWWDCVSYMVEEFRLYQNKALQQSGSKLETVQIIGMIKRSAYKTSTEVIEVRADCKGIAAMWSQTKVPAGHMPNYMSSYLIGYYHLHKIGVIKAKVLEV